MPGWRARAAPVLGAVAALSFVLTIFVGGLSGNPEHRGDRYFSNDHGRLEEITRDQYLHDRAAESRLFAGHATLFAGIATLYFTQPRPRHR